MELNLAWLMFVVGLAMVENVKKMCVNIGDCMYGKMLFSEIGCRAVLKSMKRMKRRSGRRRNGPNNFCCVIESRNSNTFVFRFFFFFFFSSS